MKKRFNVAVVGATGLVGTEMCRILEARDFPVAQFVPVASERSTGKDVLFQGKKVQVRALNEGVFEGIDLALFSAGAGPSRTYAPIAAAAGALVVDNSSAWRTHPEVPLCVPEVNIDQAQMRPLGIVANPNCATIQLVMALKPLHDAAKLTRVVVSTYQSISGAGAAAMESLRKQLTQLARGEEVERGSLPGILAGNLLMSWKPDATTGYQEEELKIIHETRRILRLPELAVSATTVRVPVISSHSEAVTLETERPLTASEARAILSKMPGIEVVDDFEAGRYPQPIDAVGRDEVFVGRIRADLGKAGGLQMWIVSDNLRKGAALNAVQIAERLLLA
ncbi:MAG: aspartate-semialdehyde dehydrogenase [Sandaracinaceae bacterium]|nr:aspartate-semialdehyde dehydrogenase [Sandaracinaceae bacterium]